MIGFDTSTLIDLYKRNEKLVKLIESLNDSYVTTIMNYQEIFFGIDESDELRTEEVVFYNSLFNGLLIYPLSESNCRKSSEILWKIKRDNKESDKFDIMTGAILLENGVDKIITKNVKHFNSIDGLEVISY